MNLSNRIVVMNGGKIVQTGSPLAVMNNPANEFVARFVGMENILSGRVLKCAGGNLLVSVSEKEICALGQAQPDEELNCCIRPENVTIHLPEDGDAPGNRNVFAGRIMQVYSMGLFLKLNLDCGFPLVSLVAQESFAELGLKEGKEIYASFKPAAVHIIPKPAGSA